MSELAYLDAGLRDPSGRLGAELSAAAVRLGHAWVRRGLDPAPVEVLAEQLARWAAALETEQVSAAQVLGALVWLQPVAAVGELLARALVRPLGRDDLAALAVHLLDIAEAMALELFVPELPGLSARAERTGDAARNVGLARHLRG